MYNNADNFRSMRALLRWLEPIYVLVGYVFESRLQQERFNLFL